jgi:Glycosyltransferase family 87
MFRKVLTILAGVVVLAAGGLLVSRLLNDSTIWPPDDYVEYWAAGRLNLDGNNPYSKATLWPLQVDAGRKLDTVDDAVMMWNPPWTLSFVMPLGALPARVGQLVWLLVHLGAMAAASLLVWNTYAGPRNRAVLAIGLSLVFVPTLFALNTGQISLFLLLGLAGYAWCLKHGYQFFAGLCCVLVAIKPHLLYLLWLAIALDAILQNRWKVIAGGLVGAVISIAIPMLFNPQVWHHYAEAYRVHPPAEHVSLTLGIPLRLLFGQEKFWLQFLPMLPVIPWFVWYRWNRRATWNTVEELPLLTLLSFLTTPYGAWHFDLVVLLLPMLQVATQLLNTARAKTALITFIAIELGMVALALSGWPSFVFAWVAPAVGLAWWLLPKQSQPAQVLVPA